jgi:hypothetical protein
MAFLNPLGTRMIAAGPIGALPDALVLGTAFLPGLDAYGTITDCDLTRTGESRDVKGRRNELIARIFENPGFELTFTAVFSTGVEPAALDMGELVTFPFLNQGQDFPVVGVIQPGTKVSWSNGGQRGLQITAAAWDHWQFDPQADLAAGQRYAGVYRYAANDADPNNPGAWIELRD